MTEAQWEWLRAQVGDVERVDAEAAYLRLGNVRDAAVEILRARRTALLADPLSVTISGVLTVSTAENVKALERDIAGLLSGPADPTVVVVDVDGAGLDEVRVVPIARRWARPRHPLSRRFYL